MTEVFEEPAVIGDPVKEEDRFVYMLASFPESYCMLVTALEANPDVPQMEVVTDRLMHDERKQRNKENIGIFFEGIGRHLFKGRIEMLSLWKTWSLQVKLSFTGYEWQEAHTFLSEQEQSTKCKQSLNETKF